MNEPSFIFIGRESQLASVRRIPRDKANGKYEAILRAAIKVFARSGFFNSKVADVAKEAGVADGTVYLYFKNKDDILVSIFNHVSEEALNEGRTRLAQLNDPVEKLKCIVHTHLDRFGRDRDLAVVFQVELRSSTKFMEQFSATKVTEYLDLIRAVIEEGQQAGVFRQDLNTTIVAKVLFGALDEMVTNWVLSRKKYNLISTADSVIDVFLNGIDVNRATLETR
jgi:TetR/AcrR family fatty acid metabolism transcriptional regulator